MKLSAILLAAGLAVSVQSEPLNGASVTKVLATALPASLRDLAAKNPASASRVISSEFAAGETPAWFSKLPHDVQTYLVPANAKHAPAPTPPAIRPMNYAFGMNGTNMTQPITKTEISTHHGHTVVGKTKTMVRTGQPSPTKKPSSPAAAGALSVPVALLSSGLLGAVGFIGMLAL